MAFPLPRRGIAWMSTLPATVLLLACGSESTGPEAPASREVPVLESHLTDLSRIILIVPPGSVSGDEVKGHAFVRTDRGPDPVPVYAPVDMRLVAGTWVGMFDDYGLDFEVNARFRFRLGHIDDPRADIAALIPRDDPSSLMTPIGPIAIEAGELLGHVTGSEPAAGFDVGLYDLDHEVRTPNAERYRRTQNWEKLNSVCPFQYFAGGLRPAYLALFGSIGGAAVPGAPCRTFGDVVGNGGIAGEWYLVSHAPDGTYPTRFALGMDLSRTFVRLAGIAGRIDVVGAADPQTTDDEACYAADGRFVYVRRTSSTTADAVTAAGDCPAVFPAGTHRSYER